MRALAINAMGQTFMSLSESRGYQLHRLVDTVKGGLHGDSLLAPVTAASKLSRIVNVHTRIIFWIEVAASIGNFYPKYYPRVNAYYPGKFTCYSYWRQ